MKKNVMLLVASLMSLVACKAETPDATTACVPGRQVECPCDGEPVGVKRCGDDGHYDACQCPTSGEGGAGGTTSTSSGGSGGGTVTGGAGGGTGGAPSCDDGNPCTIDTIDDTVCSHAPATHDVACGMSQDSGFCQPITGECCIGNDVSCCKGCVYDDADFGDVCAAVCPNGAACNPLDGRCMLAP